MSLRLATTGKLIPKGTVSLTWGLPKPVPAENRPPSSRNGSMLRKLGWFRTLTAVVRNSNDARSVSLNLLETERLPMLVISFCTGFLGTFPKGVPNTLSADPPLMMKRTWLAETGTTVLRPPGWFSAFTLTSWVGEMVQTGSVPVMPKMKQASPANAPTEVTGAALLPKNGRATSVPTKAPTNLASKKSPAAVEAATWETCAGV